MYCRNCGKHLEEQDKFCVECGTGVSGQIGNAAQPSADTGASNSYVAREGINSGKLTTILLCLGSAALTVILFASPWISVPVLSGFNGLFGTRTKSEFTIFEIYSFASKANSLIDIDETAGLKAIALLILLMSIAAVICYLIFCYKLIRDFENSTGFGKAAYILFIIVSLALYLLIYIVNKKVNSGFDDIAINALMATDSSFIVLLTGIIGLFKFIKGINTVSYEYGNYEHDYDNNLLSSGQSMNSKSAHKQIKLVECEKCGEEYFSSRSYCPKCGYRRH
jgi:ribosomal protein L37E